MHILYTLYIHYYIYIIYYYILYILTCRIKNVMENYFIKIMNTRSEYFGKAIQIFPVGETHIGNERCYYVQEKFIVHVGCYKNTNHLISLTEITTERLFFPLFLCYLLMAGTLIVYHCPMRPINVKC
jgi:hypothetical protein